MAIRTRRSRLHAAKEGLLNFGNIARATASSTSGVGSSRCSTSAVTAVALNISWQTNLLFHSVGYIMECNAHFHTQIGTTALLRASTSGTETAAKAAAKNITEMSEYVLHRHAAAKTGTAAKAATHIAHIVAKLVVASTFILVAQHIVSLGSLLELLFGLFFLSLRFVSLAVGVIFHGHLAVGLLQFLVSSVFVNAKHLVIISFFLVHRSKEKYYWPTTTLLWRSTLSLSI